MSSEPGIDGREFRRVLGHFATGVTVVTAETADGPAGMAIGSFSSVSLDPPLVMFCPSRDSVSWAKIRTGDSFCVNVLGHHQRVVCETFASSVEDKFVDLEVRTEVTGAPVIAGSLAWIDCTYYAVYDGGDHEIVIGLVKALGTDQDGFPLMFFRGGYGRYEEL